MNLTCPHCRKGIDFDETMAGNTIECPHCHQTFLVPRSPQSAAVKKVRSGIGCETFFWLLLLAAAGAFGYAMYSWKTSPRDTLQRIVTTAQSLIEGKPAPTPPEEEVVVEETPPPPRPMTTPRPDPMVWIVQHKEHWPNEVILREPMEFPAVSGGKAVGSLVVPAGAVVKVKEITAQDIGADFMGGERRVLLGATDLRARADAALRRAELEAKQTRTVAAATTPAPKSVPKTIDEDPAQFRDAAPDDIAKGLGAMYTRSGTTFRLFAPNARAVSVILYNEATGNEGRMVTPLRQQLNGLWDGTLRGDLHGKFYNYLLDGNDPKNAREVVDPYATNSVASSTRGRITPLTKPVGPGPKLEAPTDAIVYEMHVRDFTVAPNSGVENAGLYLGWTEQGTHLPDDMQIRTAVDHLVELGVTHVQIMPVQDFENDESAGAYNWGYVTSNFFSPEGMFASNPNDGSRVRELKALVAALHAHGISANMDVVYNHTAGKCSFFDIAPDYYYRRGLDGKLANGSGCGNEVKSESPMGRRLIIDSLKYWVKEFGFDGFRFDLMALIDQDTMRQADRELRKLNPGIMIYGEPWTGGNTPLTSKSDKGALHQVPVGAFNDDFRNALKGSPDGNDPGWIQNGSNKDALKAAMLLSQWFNAPGQSMNYMTCHDNLVLWDKLNISMSGASDELKIETMKLGYLALFTSQGVPFFHGGEEFARSKGGNKNSYDAPDSVNEVDWSLKREHNDLFSFVRDAIALRKAHPLFRLRTRPQVTSRVQFINTPEQRVLMFTVNGEGVPGETWRRACIILNSDDTADSEISVPPGNWKVALDAGGAVAAAQAVSGKVLVRHKSGVVLFQ